MLFLIQQIPYFEKDWIFHSRLPVHHHQAEAGASSGERADELKKKGQQLLASSVAKAQELEKFALDSAKSVATSTDVMVHQNPWRAIAVAGVVGAGIGLVLGMAINQK